MKHTILFILAFTFCLLACKQEAEQTKRGEPSVKAKEIKTGYNAELAKKLKADDYGMHKYVFAMLKRGPNRDFTPEKAAELQRAHMENIGRLAEEGKLVLAGPFLDNGEWRGIYVFDVETVEEAEALTKTDPAIQAGSLVMELHPWYGSAAMMQINEVHNQIAKENP